jgi:primary-amine oxidase
MHSNSVVWFNLGMHHMPHTGDLPNTVFTTAYSAMTIEPFNYNAGDPSMATSQRVLLKAGDTGATITRYGAVEGTCAIDQVRRLQPSRTVVPKLTSLLLAGPVKSRSV